MISTVINHVHMQVTGTLLVFWCLPIQNAQLRKLLIGMMRLLRKYEIGCMLYAEAGSNSSCPTTPVSKIGQS